MNLSPMCTDVDDYLARGCGRCDLWATPDCKVHRWHEILVRLRQMVLEEGLEEFCKWGQPCYQAAGRNMLILSAFKDHAFLNFFRGSELPDPAGLLELTGPNAQDGRMIRFTSLSVFVAHEKEIRALVRAARQLEEAGPRAKKAGVAMDIPEEFQERLDADPELTAAFFGLTPGRQRSYLIHISGAKQSATRVSRIEKCVPSIFAGKGHNEY